VLKVILLQFVMRSCALENHQSLGVSINLKKYFIYITYINNHEKYFELNSSGLENNSES